MFSINKVKSNIVKYSEHFSKLREKVVNPADHRIYWKYLI